MSHSDFANSSRTYEGYRETDSAAQEDAYSYRPARNRFSADALKRFSMDELTSYDLNPPPPAVSEANAEYIASRLFSAGHLDVILKDTHESRRFRSFLEKYRPGAAATLVRYLESQKALAAIRYANSLANVVSATRPPQAQGPSRSSSVKSEAAVIDTQFESFAQKAVDDLVTEALPAYITHRMITVVTECLVKDITETSTPFMRDLVQGLAEVFCLSDPNQPDSPLVFASEEFYNTTQYNQDYVIGKNCRFLQGPATSKAAIKRISTALDNGQEISELLLNYRRSGQPFLNLVMMAPLMDQRGHVRYFLGAQVDITRLLEGGKGLQSLKQLFDQEKAVARIAGFGDKSSLMMLRELGGLLNEEEADIVRQQRQRTRPGSASSADSMSTRHIPSSGRRFIGMEDTADDNIWPARRFGPEGRLPGVYQNYLLVRPYPSLRIIFTSPALRIPGLSQSKLMDRIGGPQHVRESLREALAQGTSVTAKVSWLAHSHRSNENGSFAEDASMATLGPPSALESRPRWIQCTPMLGSDSKPGVYMIVMVDKEEITGTLIARQNTVPPAVRSRDLTGEAWPYRESSSGYSAARYPSTKLYADYLKREGTISEDSSYTQQRTPRNNRASLEDDTRLGRVNAGLAMVDLGADERRDRSAAGRPPSRMSRDEEQSGPDYKNNISMGVGPPTPHRKQSPSADMDA
ncbi:uncharacterized protein CC84DRAFT_1078982 [Paraphaeosphaeria sporulosa]|uniref:PAC domain-containing protein n=1 Tax=Paraphaeosphaeria sporulosa TaxID=1460663 RepID=A0A177CY90_9PLEO|nr:uncharacterized protein CC84DRAFT_1078982 [Paraphaeosphaeria sporulosa]OAG12535.1 hypothetical protein CC84DRAFT_1078982 [Paraphaeosphaeria sporulosa]